MDKDKEKQEISLVGRLFSLEALLIIMGVLSIVSGIINDDAVRLFIGAVILAILVLFVIFRKRASRK